ncbi:MAG: hypothetical protein OXP11_19605 [Gammaproteobacteria bacterium]|nr:hypothetical protein [Gammaproteobacteria bacterium]
MALAQAPDQHVVAIDERLDGMPEGPVRGCVKLAAARKLDVGRWVVWGDDPEPR